MKRWSFCFVCFVWIQDVYCAGLPGWSQTQKISLPLLPECQKSKTSLILYNKNKNLFEKILTKSKLVLEYSDLFFNRPNLFSLLTPTLHFSFLSLLDPKRTTNTRSLPQPKHDVSRIWAQLRRDYSIPGGQIKLKGGVPWEPVKQISAGQKKEPLTYLFLFEMGWWGI